MIVYATIVSQMGNCPMLGALKSNVYKLIVICSVNVPKFHIY